MSYQEFKDIRDGMEYNMMYEFGEIDNSLLADGLRQWGDFSYDTDGIFDFFEKNKNDFDRDQSLYRPDDNKGLLVNEHSFIFYLINKNMILKGDKKGDPGNAPTFNDLTAVAKGHTHPNDGRDVFALVNGRWGTYTFKPGTSQHDIDHSWNDGKHSTTRFFDVVVDGNRNKIYFYNRSGVIATYEKKKQ